MCVLSLHKEKKRGEPMGPCGTPQYRKLTCSQRRRIPVARGGEHLHNVLQRTKYRCPLLWPGQRGGRAPCRMGCAPNSGWCNHIGPGSAKTNTTCCGSCIILSDNRRQGQRRRQSDGRDGSGAGGGDEGSGRAQARAQAWARAPEGRRRRSGWRGGWALRRRRGVGATGGCRRQPAPPKPACGPV